MLPLGAFEHYGNRHIKLYGGGGSWNPVEIVENAVSSVGDAVSDVVQGAGDVLADVDEFVGDTIPGGWTTVASVAVPYAAPMVTGAALTAGQAAALAAATSATSGAIQGKDPEDILKNAALAAAGSYIGKGGLSDSGVPNWDADITAGAEGYANAAGAAGAGAGSGLSADMNLDAPYVDMPDGEYLLNESIDQGGLPNWDADITAGAEGYEEAGGLPSYPGDSQYIEQDLQEQARNTDVPSGSSTSWDRGDTSLPSLQETANAINKARQVYNLGNALMGGSSPTARTRTAGYLPSGIEDLSGGFTGSSDLIKNLTPGLTAAKQDYTLSGLPDIDETVNPVRFEAGGSVDPYATDTTIGKSTLKPALTKAQLNYILTGLPGNLIGKAEGGSIQEHKPEFFSEGGLGSMKNRYVKGRGDGTSDSIPAMLANGEFVIPADVVSSLGNGSNDAGATILDEFLKTIRKHKRAADVKKLPPDSKGALGYLLEAKRKVKA
jgi:hypothetical protein